MQGVTLRGARAQFPHAEMRPAQELSFRAIEDAHHGIVLEVPTGEGKTAIGLTALKVIARHHAPNPVFYVTPTKNLVEQVRQRYPDDTVEVFGRSEHPCLYYTSRGEEVNAQESPCYMLKCPHRVDMATGLTEDPDVEPCPYYQQKFNALEAAKDGKIVVCTTAFFMTNRIRTNWKQLNPAAVVVDEGHRLADITRGLFEHSLTDYNLKRLYVVMRRIEALKEQAQILKQFINTFRRMCKRRPSRKEALLEQDEVQRLIDILMRLDRTLIEREVRAEVDRASAAFNERDLLRLLQTIVVNLPSLVNGLQRSLSEMGEDADGQEVVRRNPLNYVVAFYRKIEEMGPRRKVQYELSVRSYYVAPLIRMALGPHPIVMSATIGNHQVFNWEVGLRRLPFISIPASFPVRNTRMYLPTDSMELSVSKIGEKQYKRVIKDIVRRMLTQAQTFAGKGHRSLIVVISEQERQTVIEQVARFALDVVTYGDTLSPRAAAREFVAGRGHVLLGTVAQYGEGIDLPRQQAPVIFFLKPGYPSPEDPQAVFEQRRFGSSAWALWQWRVMIRALQVRGRNVRSDSDLGVCFFVDSRFGRFMAAGTPAWLQPAFRNGFTFEQGTRDALELLEGRA